MNKKLKKSLILLSTTAILLNGNIGPKNYSVFATNPSDKKTEKSEEYKFYGENGICYTLGDFVGRGNQSISYGCTDQNGEEWVVKIPIDEFPVEAFDSQGKPSRSTFCEVLQQGSAHKGTVTQSTASSIGKEVSLIGGNPSDDGAHSIPPPRPTKLVTIRSRLTDVPPTPRRLFESDYSDDSEEEDEVNPIGSLGGELSEEDIDQSLFKRNSSSSSTAQAATVRPLSPDTYRPQPKIRATAAEFSRSSERNRCAASSSSAAASIPVPDEHFLHKRIMDSSALSILQRNPTPFVISIPSASPYVESRYPNTLKDLMEKRLILLRPDTVFNILMDILQGLRHLHNLGICHQDIKPDNIFVNSSGRMVIGDLGTARLFNDAVGDINGTCFYMAPEVWRMNTRDPLLAPRADIFSLGIMALDMLTCDFHADEREEADKECTQKNRNIVGKIDIYHMRDGNPIPDAWKRFIRACLMENPSKRPTAEIAMEFLRETER